jgi:glutamine synthetase
MRSSSAKWRARWAFRLGHRVIFSPVVELGEVGNGTHIHLSLTDRRGTPVMYDPSRPYSLSAVAETFVAGILRHLPALAALTAPSVVSYYRLRPNRWAPTWTNLRTATAAHRCACVRSLT